MFATGETHYLLRLIFHALFFIEYSIRLLYWLLTGSFFPFFEQSLCVFPNQTLLIFQTDNHVRVALQNRIDKRSIQI